MQLDLPMSATSESDEASSGQISSAADSLAKTSRSPASGPAYPDQNRDYGPNSTEPFASFDHESRSWKTFQRLSLADSTSYSGAWPSSGMMRSGKLYQLVMWGHATYDDEYSSSRMLPTPSATEHKGAPRNRYRGSPNYRGSRMVEGLRDSEECPATVSPRFVELAMGFPTGWTDCDASETQ